VGRHPYHCCQVDDVHQRPIITTSAYADMTGLHDCRPVILDQIDWPVWLGEAQGDRAALLRPAPDGMLRIWVTSVRGVFAWCDRLARPLPRGSRPWGRGSWMDPCPPELALFLAGLVCDSSPADRSRMAAAVASGSGGGIPTRRAYGQRFVILKLVRPPCHLIVSPLGACRNGGPSCHSTSSRRIGFIRP
jgi:hypothetical protein